jgi:hypothetical protein
MNSAWEQLSAEEKEKAWANYRMQQAFVRAPRQHQPPLVHHQPFHALPSVQFQPQQGASVQPHRHPNIPLYQVGNSAQLSLEQQKLRMMQADARQKAMAASARALASQPQYKQPNQNQSWGQLHPPSAGGRPSNKPAWMTASHSANPVGTAPAVEAAAERTTPSTKVVWPDSLKRFVERNLKTCSSMDEKARVQEELRPLITNAVKTGTLNDIDWDQQPLVLQTKNNGDKSEVTDDFNTLSEETVNELRNYTDKVRKHLLSQLNATATFLSVNTSVPFTAALKQGLRNTRIGARDILNESSVGFVFFGEPLMIKLNTVGTSGHTLSEYPGSANLDRNIYFNRIQKFLQQQNGRARLAMVGSAVPLPTSLKGNKMKAILESSNLGFVFDGSGGNASISLPHFATATNTPKRKRSDHGMAAPMESKRFRDDRITNFRDVHANGRLLKADAREMKKRQQRAGRFSGTSETRSASMSQSREDELMQKRTLNRLRSIAEHGGDVNWDLVIVKGTCRNLEKDYFRLTSAPDPSTVRPEPVLKKAFQIVLSHWNNKTKSFEWLNNQVKAIRQDITVQHIKSDFVVSVYEEHAKMCLGQGDILEVNQCITKVCEFYEEGLAGAVDEFMSYRLLYLIYTRQKYKEGASELNLMMAKLHPMMESSKYVRHAIAVQDAVANDFFGNFFALYKEAPVNSALLMNFLSDYMRWKGLRAISRSFRNPAELPIRFIVENLGYSGEKECVADLNKHGAVLAKKHGQVFFDAQSSLQIYSRVFVFKVLDGDSLDEK